MGLLLILWTSLKINKNFVFSEAIFCIQGVNLKTFHAYILVSTRDNKTH